MPKTHKHASIVTPCVSPKKLLAYIPFRTRGHTLPVDIIVEFVVTPECDHSANSNRIGEENLSPTIYPHLHDQTTFPSVQYSNMYDQSFL